MGMGQAWASAAWVRLVCLGLREWVKALLLAAAWLILAATRTQARWDSCWAPLMNVIYSSARVSRLCGYVHGYVCVRFGSRLLCKYQSCGAGICILRTYVRDLLPCHVCLQPVSLHQAELRGR